MEFLLNILDFGERGATSGSTLVLVWRLQSGIGNIITPQPYKYTLQRPAVAAGTIHGRFEDQPGQPYGDLSLESISRLFSGRAWGRKARK